MQTYNIKTYTNIDLAGQGTALVIHRFDNECPDIKAGDTIITDNGTFEITKLEQFKKSFDRPGDNVTVLVKRK